MQSVPQGFVLAMVLLVLAETLEHWNTKNNKDQENKILKIRM